MKIRIKRILLPTLVFALFFTLSCENDEPELDDNTLNGRTTAVFNSNKKYGKVIDVDGNLYKTIVIGTQTWMAENLRTTSYRNGEIIYKAVENTEWSNLTNAAYCNYNNTNNLDTIATYGRLYNWFAAADERGIAPKGWRIPTIADWDILIEYLGGDTIAGNKMKEAGNLHWDSPNGSDNSSGFTALPGGRRYKSNNSNDIGYYSIFWAIPSYNESAAPFLYLFSWNSIFYRGLNYKVNGYSIRCIKE